MESKILQPCSPEKKSRKRERSAEAEREGEEEKKGKSCNSLKPLITTVTKTTTSTASITIITPPENPNTHIDLFFCVRAPIGPRHDDKFTWFKIDPNTHKSVYSTKPPKDKPVYQSISNHNYNFNDDNNKKTTKKKKKKNQRILLSPVSHMPLTTPRLFRAVSSTSDKNKKLIYAFGGIDFVDDEHNFSSKSKAFERPFSSKAFVCDFTNTSTSSSENHHLVWEELPPMLSPLKIHSGVSSPLDGNVYVFGVMACDSVRAASLGKRLVFDPSSKSWTPCRHSDSIEHYGAVKDYTLVSPSNRLVVFDAGRGPHSFNLATATWESNNFPSLPITNMDTIDNGGERQSSCVAVGNIIYRLKDRKLFALDSSLPFPYWVEVRSFENKLPTHWDTRAKRYIAYLGKGKLCILWGRDPNFTDDEPEGALYVSCLKFWVGMCNRKNRLRAVMDRCDRYVARGGGSQLYDVIAL